ncbi:MAG TPA: PAS domain S-box protein, partial [Bryobacteraceae bacterium]|nr:PAS domain S-box protein [Bryobacteraceae bacterium]
WRKAAGAVLMGIAISAMHYTGMDGASFTRFAVAPDLSHAVSISSLGIAGIATVVVMVLGVAFLSCLADRIQMQRMLLDQLFEQAPEAVALIDVHNHVVRVNSEFTQVFGYTAEEILGRRLYDFIIPAGSQDEMQTKTELGARGQRMDAEGISRRKDGSQLQVAMVQVPVSVEGGLIAIYAIYRDITKYKQAEKALHVLSRRLLQLQDDERRRIAQDLHDSTAQLLASLTMNLSVVNESAHVLDPRAERALAESESLVDQCLREIRTVSYLLHPPELDHLGLQSALARYVDGFIQRSGIQVELDVSPDLGRLPQELEVAIFRIVQECLTNLHRHSNSHTGSIHLTRTPAELMLEVKDEGEGMRGNATLGIGIASMRERAQQFGGRLEIVSQDVGMKVKVVVPLSGAAPWTHFPS